MRPSFAFVLLLGLTSTHCGAVENDSATEEDSAAEDDGAGGSADDEVEPIPESCPRLLADENGEWVPLERREETFGEIVMSRDGEDSFRTLSCGVENSSRQPSFEWRAPYDGSFSFSFTLPDFSLPSPIVSLSVLSGDCRGEEVFCKSSITTRVGFDLDLTAGQEVTVMIELDDRVGAEDTEIFFAVLDSELFD
jgi:hypothetical protein